MFMRQFVRLALVSFAISTLASTVVGDEPQKSEQQPQRAVVQVLAQPTAAGGVGVQDAANIQRLKQALLRQLNSMVPQIPQDLEEPSGTERILLLAPDEPLVIQLEMTIDGKPYRSGREKMVDELLEVAAAVDFDWARSMESRKFRIGRLNSTAPEVYTELFDRNGDKKIDRYECRLMLAVALGVPALQIFTNNANFNLPDIFELLDADQDKQLSKEELAAAEQRLKSRDRDGNDLLELTELTSNNNPVQRNRVSGTDNSLIRIIGRQFDAQATHKTLADRYGVADRLPAKRLPSLREELDTDNSALIEASELAALATLPPHLHLEVRLGTESQETNAIRVTVRSVRPELGKLEEIVQPIRDGLRITSAGLQLDLMSADAKSVVTYASSAQAMITRLDKDKNGYIDEKDIDASGQQAAYYKPQFEAWDANGDGKVYADDIAAYYEEQTRRQNDRIMIAATEVGGALLDRIDETGDRRVSLREMQNAAERLAMYDADQDGAIARREVPRNLRLAVARGANAYAMLNPNQRLNVAYINQLGAGPVTSANPGPEWFQRMDRNGDGDITPKEFLGELELFEKLDTNHNGFLEVSEAYAAEKS